MIPITKPYITSREVLYVDSAVTHGMIGAGEYVQKFEDAWKSYNGYAHGIACSSGSAALYLALRALGVGPGDKVVVPDFTSIACAAAVTMCGATPVFVDCDTTLNIDPELLERVFEDKFSLGKIKAVIAVAIYGRALSNKIFELASRYDVPVVEDLAEAHGVKPRGDIVCYSFYGNKILTTGEGGMCLTQDDELAKEIRNCANFYFDKERSNWHEKIGWNFRMTNLQAAVGLGQVENVDEIIRLRQQVMDWYAKYLPVRFATPQRDVGWLYDICVPDIMLFKKKLDDAGIANRHFFKPLRLQPPYWKQNPAFLSKGIADELCTRGLLLPLYPEMTEEQVKEICETLAS